MISKKDRIAYLSLRDPMDLRSNSGLQYYMNQTIERYCGTVDLYYPKGLCIIYLTKVFMKLHKWKTGRYTLFYNGKLAALLFGIYFTIYLARSRNKYDYIFISRGSGIIPYLVTKIPIIYCSDTTFSLMYGYYKSFSWITYRQFLSFDKVEQAAIRRSKLLFYPTCWAANSAIRDYKADKSKVFILPSGANIPKEILPSEEEIPKRKCSSPVNLLFIGKDWQGKGGEIASNALKLIKKKMCATTLTVIGCKPPT